MFPKARRLIRLDRSTVALLTAVTVLVTVVGVTVASPPDAIRPSGLDGRTWMEVSTGDGPGLVLLNGFSGLVEARARADAELPARMRFASSGADRTLLAGSAGVVVVNDGLHDATALDVAARGAVLVGRDVLVVDRGGQASIRRPGDDPTRLSLGGDDVVSGPVLDGDGVAWLLTEHAAGFRAWKVGEDLDPAPLDLPATATSIAVVDGELMAVTRTGMVALGSGDDRAAPGGATLPTVAVDTRGTWAYAERTRVAVADGGEVEEATLDEPVEQLVVWAGAVLATTANGAYRVADGEATPVGEFEEAPRVHVDGGLLWLTSRNRVTAVWDDQTEVSFELAAIDLDLCVDDCEADDVRRFLDEQDEDPQEPTERTTTTLDRSSSRARDLRPPAVEPSIPTTTTTTTTEAPRQDDEQTNSRPRPSTTTTTTTEAPAPTTATTELPARIQPPSTESSPPPDPEPRPWPPGLLSPLLPDLRPGGPGPDRPTDPSPPPTIESPQPTPPPPTDPTSPEPPPEPPPGSVSLVLGLERSDGAATATVGIQGRAVDCDALVSRSTTGTVSWSGAASGSRQVTLSWSGLGNSSSSTEQLTIADVGAGELTVSFSACGVQTSRTIGDPDAPPTVSAMSIDPPRPHVGESFTASVAVEASNGWTVSSADWHGGPCGNEVDVAGDGLSQTFTAESPGRFCVSVIVTLAEAGGRSDRQTRSGEVDVVDTTTSTTAPTTTTTAPTTTTTAPTTTTTAPTTSTTAAPAPTTGEPES